MGIAFTTPRNNISVDGDELVVSPLCTFSSRRQHIARRGSDVGHQQLIIIIVVSSLVMSLRTPLSKSRDGQIAGVYFL